MNGKRITALVLGSLLPLALLGGCGGDSSATTTTAPASAEPEASKENASFESRVAGLSAELPAGWRALGTACNSQELCRIVVAGSLPVKSDSETFRSVPPGKVYVQIYEHPKYVGRASASRQFRRWLGRHYPQRDSTTFALSHPSRREGGWGFNVFFQQNKRALQALVLTHGPKLAGAVKGETEEFLRSLNFEPIPQSG